MCSILALEELVHKSPAVLALAAECIVEASNFIHEPKNCLGSLAGHLDWGSTGERLLAALGCGKQGLTGACKVSAGLRHEVQAAIEFRNSGGAQQ